VSHFQLDPLNPLFSISTTNDSIHEGDEYFQLTMLKDSLSNCAHYEYEFKMYTNVRIIDDDIRKFLWFMH